jgi:glycosyltransferase involved in cell wall biosynthesis
MKILMITYNKTGRGTFLRAYEFARSLSKAGHQLTLISTASKRQNRIISWDENDITIVEMPALCRSPLRSGWDIRNILKRISWLKDQSFDIVHGFESRPTVIYPALFLNKKNTPMVLDWCDWFGKGGSVEERPSPIMRMILRPIETYFENHFRTMADATTVICHTLYSKALDIGVNQDNLSLIPNGLNMPGWRPKSRKGSRRIFNYTKEDFVIGYVGSLFPIDAELMTNAFSLIYQQIPTAKLLHLGKSNYHINIDNTIDKNCYRITGVIDDEILHNGLAACDVCWLPFSDIPANWGRFPLKFTAYLAAGKPVVATNVGDIPDLLTQHKAGLVCPPTVEGLLASITYIYQHPALLKDMGDAALELSRNPNFSWDAMAKRLIRVYKTII